MGEQPIAEGSVIFNKKLFNNIYWHIKEACENQLIRFIWIYGGSSASKTYSLVQFLIVDMLSGSDNNALVLRKFHVDIKDSIYADFKNIIIKWKLHDYFIIQQDFIKCKTGSYVRFRGLDDAEKVKGITGFKRVILEEISQFEEEDLKQIRKRLRGREGQQIVGLFNPISEEHWIKKNVFDLENLIEYETNICGKWINDTGNTLILKTNYFDNRFIVGPDFIDQHVIDDFEKDKALDLDYYEIYGLGNWGQIKTGKEFYHQFHVGKHVRKNKYNPNVPVHITYDFNYNPYMTLLVFQIEYNNEQMVYEVNGLFELCFEWPNNSTKDVTLELVKIMKLWEPNVKFLYYYGDYSGRNNTSMRLEYKNEMMDHQFSIIEIILRELDWELFDRVIPNPAHFKRRDFMVDILTEQINVRLYLDESMEKTKKDFIYMKQGADGWKHKHIVRDKQTGLSYEEFTHTSDGLEYLLCSAFENIFAQYGDRT